MINDPLLISIKEVLAREWALDAAAIPDDAALNLFEKWDSLGHISILLALQSRFALELTADTIQSLTSLPRIVEHIAARQVAKAA